MYKQVPFIMGALILLFAIWVQITSLAPITHFINQIENISYDMQLRTKLFLHPAKPSSFIAIVDIDDKSLRQEGRWPWSRAKLAALVEQLQTGGAAVIALDMLFPEPEKNIATLVLNKLEQEQTIDKKEQYILKNIESFFDEDKKFAAALAKSDTVLGMSFLPYANKVGAMPTPLSISSDPIAKTLNFITFPGVIGNLPLLQTAAKQSGFINAFPDEDGIVRRAPLLMRFQNNLYPSLALATAQLYLLNNITLVTAKYGQSLRLEAVKLAKHLVRTNDQGQIIIPFMGPSYTFPYYSATDVLNKKLPAGIMAGKIVFIGTSATGVGDLKATPVQNVFPGVEIQASITEGILSGHLYYQPAWSLGAEIFITAVLGSIFVIAFPYFGPRLLSILIVLLPVTLIILNNWLFEKTGLIISIFIPGTLLIILAFVNMIYGYLFETRRRERLKKMFGQYVPSKHIDAMLKTSGTYGFYGEDREMTVLFADIRNFTTISESLTATQLKEMLNNFFTPMTKVIFRHSGTIDKYIGDMVMAFWGAPLKDKKHATHAIQAALEMQKKVAELQDQFSKKNWGHIKLGIGINSGMMSVGDMGSKYRRNYTVIGDTVNLASRAEDLTKFYGVNILVTEATKGQHKQFIFQQIDRVKVKGRSIVTNIYAVICEKKELTETQAKEIHIHTQAFHHYLNREWEQAQQLFKELHELHPHTKLYAIFLHRISEFLQAPPPLDWDGVYTHTVK